MSGQRFVIFGVARARAPWFSELQRWASTATVPLDFVRCLSLDELRVRLDSGPPASAVLLDSTIAGVDRDLLDTICTAGASPVAVGDSMSWPEFDDLEWQVLPSSFTRDDLLGVLEQNARSIRRADEPVRVDAKPRRAPWRGRFVAVTGTAGSGTSTAATALAQALAGDPRNHGMILLADMARRADLGVLHDARSLIPALSEAIEAHRGRTPSARSLRELVHTVEDRHYDVLLGLRRPREWTSIRPKALDALLENVQSTYRTVVADTDNDVEGLDETGSADVEERNVLTRACIQRADLVVVTGTSGVLGVHGLARLTNELIECGVERGRLLLVVNRFRGGPRQRSDTAKALAELIGPGSDEDRLASPIFLPERKRLDDLLLDDRPMPSQLAAPLASTVEAHLLRQKSSAASIDDPVQIAPGSLGHWADAEVSP